MRSLVLYFFLFVLSCIILIRCASTGSPNGGPRDTTPPGLVEEESDVNFTTNFSPERIELVFDEWIELKNPVQEILISPPFFKRPKITSRGKKVTIEFPEDEPLRPDATYTINFGKSIVDFTESNPMEGFRYVFATGEKLDSLTFEGIVVDAYGGEAIGEVLVLLYDVLSDSVVVEEKPFYYARTDQDGTFKFENLKNDTFKILVLEDKNVNYLLDPELERLAFTDSLFVLNDSSNVKPSLRLFLPEQSARILDSSSKQKGVIYTTFNVDPEEVEVSYLYPENFNPIREIIGDTIKFWFSEPIDSTGIVFGLDTLDFTVKPFDSLFYAQTLKLGDSKKKIDKLAPFDSLKIAFSAPIMNIDTSLMTLSDRPKPVRAASGVSSIRGDSLGLTLDSLTANQVDSLEVQDSINIDSILAVSSLTDSLIQDSTLVDTLLIEEDSIAFYTFSISKDIRSLIISTVWKENHKYQLILNPGALTDIYGRINDTLVVDFETTSLDEYGNIALNVSGMDSTNQYVVLLRLGDEEIDKKVINQKSSEIVNFKRLPVNKYIIHLIHDENEDNKWTTGDYWMRRQPELLKEFELDQLRENWDLEANISWDGTAVAKTDSIGMARDSLMIPLDSLERKPNIKPERNNRSNRTPRGKN